MTGPIRVLHLEDSPQDAELLHEHLKAGGVSADIVLVAGKEGFEAAVAGEVFDLILSDYNLPDYDGMTAVRLVKQRQPETPVIVVSGTVGEEEAVKSLHIGAADYLLKHRLDRLVPAVQRALREAAERRRRQDAEQALRQREQRLSSIYKAVADGLFYLDVEEEGRHRFVTINDAFTSITGLDSRDVVGRLVNDVLPEPLCSLFLEQFAETIRQRKVVRWEGTAECPKGRLTVDVNVAPVFSDAGHCTHLVGSVRDNTERKQLEAQFRQAQKMESVGQLAGGIAHDFNNLLTVINGTAELALEQVKESDALYEDLLQIRRTGERAAALTRQLLAFSRKQILQPRVLNLTTLVGELAGMLRRLIGEDIALVVVPTAGVGHVMADPGQLEQVLVNLAVNACDAMPQGGQMTIEMQNVQMGDGHTTKQGVAVPPGPYVMLAVSDTGTGMDEATRQRLFEPFFTTKAPGKGTGLGLATVYGIVKQSNGFIWVYSEVGHGTSFKIHLPQVVGEAVATQARPVVASARGTETILVVEDEAGLRHLTQRALTSAGYTVLTADHGEAALRVLDQHDGPVHLMITDVVMPGMGGRTLAERCHATQPGLKVLYMSGYTDDVVVRHGVLDASMPFLGKPFTVAELTRKVREVLEAAGGPEQINH